MSHSTSEPTGSYSKTTRISSVEDTDLLVSFDVLLHLAQEQGYLTTDNLLSEIPEPEDHMQDLEKLFLRLVAQGIEIYPDVETAQNAFYDRENNLDAIHTEITYGEKELSVHETRIHIAHLSPSFRVLEKLLRGKVELDQLHWRAFEELIAELLEKDGYAVQLGPGRNDGGIDIIAQKDLGHVGLFKSVWQAKKKKQSNKVGISVIRELADARNEHKASKGIVVTTTYLTRGALERVDRDRYILGKVDRDDLFDWMERILWERR